MPVRPLCGPSVDASVSDRLGMRRGPGIQHLRAPRAQVRWFKTCINQPEFLAVIGVSTLHMGSATPAATPAAPAPAPAPEKKEKAPKEKKEKAPKEVGTRP